MDPGSLDFDHIPAMEPPTGVIPNFETPDSLAPAGKIMYSVALPVMIIIVIIRLYTRLHITRAIGADDWLCIAGTAAVISYCGVSLSIFEKGYLGPHQWNVPLSTITPEYIRGSVVVTCLYGASSIFIKTSLLVLYLRIFRPSSAATIIIWLGIGLIVAFYITTIISTAVFCNPLLWPPTSNPIEFAAAQNKGKCNQPQLHLSAVRGIFSTVSDFYVLAIPTVLIWSLQLPLMRRVGIVAIFLVGLIATGSSIATVVFRFRQLNSADFSWYSAMNMILGGAELMAGIICSCLPVAFVTFRRVTITSWISLTHYVKTLRSRPNGVITDSNESKLVKDSVVSTNKLPKIPRATITGLRTFMWGSSRGQPRELSELSTYNEINSIDDEYHLQLKSAQHTVSPLLPLSARTAPSRSTGF
ncbi:hypothetical protein F5Y00DRAFT_273856 [Daldinia vernicosa]|uniref:uncharacterized protein n=1 Tax=Daldinia vernicosa TaxID=114800 RepID=UPI002007F2F6|nr:uncharacterized protein F5Y00DRAFT_273856 [Daldinia vernicosa]KAI0844616.1 hypothetical protein F5Y00DRAFT_273856 [Daldinia vernicosa]